MNGNLLIWILAIPLVVSLLAFGARAVPVRAGALRARPGRIPACRQGALEVLHVAGVTLLLLLSLFLAKTVLAGGSVAAGGAWLYADQLTAVFVLVIGVMGFLNGLYSSVICGTTWSGKRSTGTGSGPITASSTSSS